MRKVGRLLAAIIGALLWCSTAAAGDYYLKLDGVDGESQGSLSKVSVTIEHSVTHVRVGAYSFGSVMLTRAPDSFSSTIRAGLAKQAHYPIAEINLGTRTICLGDASIGSVKDEGPTESVSLNFQQVHYEYGSGSCSKPKDPVVLAVGDTGGVHIDCLVPHCAGSVKWGSEHVSFNVAGGRSQPVTLSVTPGRSYQGTVTLKGYAPIVETTYAPPASAPSQMFLVCAVYAQQGTVTSVSGGASRASAGQSVTITWTSPSGKMQAHHAVVRADGQFSDSLTPDESGTWKGVAQLGGTSATCSLPVNG